MPRLNSGITRNPPKGWVVGQKGKCSTRGPQSQAESSGGWSSLAGVRKRCYCARGNIYIQTPPQKGRTTPAPLMFFFLKDLVFGVVADFTFFDPPETPTTPFLSVLFPLGGVVVLPGTRRVVCYCDREDIHTRHPQTHDHHPEGTYLLSSKGVNFRGGRSERGGQRTPTCLISSTGGKSKSLRGQGLGQNTLFSCPV